MNIPKNAKIYDTPLTTCWMGDDGIVYSVSKPNERTIANYEILFDVYAELSENGKKKFCIIGDITDAKPLEPEVRKFVEVETAKYIRAMALVSKSTLGEAIGSVFKLLSSNPYPIATFDNYAEALRWLNLQKVSKDTSIV
jgi:hypothetical protein